MNSKETMYVIGRNAVREVLESEHEVYQLFVLSSSKDETLASLVKLAQTRRIRVDYKTRDELNQIQKGNHQGIIAACAGYAFVQVEDILKSARKRGETPFILILESIQDPHNLGAIIRTAETAGVHGVIISKNRSVGLTYAAAKTAAGALEYVPVAQVTNLVRTIDQLKKEGLWVACADMDGDEIYDTDLTGPIALVIGGEHEGVGRLVKEHCDLTVRLPMQGHITSLNASVAAGISVYEIVRQRREKAHAQTK